MTFRPLLFCLKSLIRLYQAALSPFWPGVCRFQPTCSHYALEALQQEGALLGSWLTLRRLIRCHPWGGSGSDPVPSPSSAKK